MWEFEKRLKTLLRSRKKVNLRSLISDASLVMIPVFDWWRVVIRVGCVSIGGAEIDFILWGTGGTSTERGKQWQMGGKNQDRLPRTRVSQSDVPLFTMAHKNNGWCLGTPDGDHGNHFFPKLLLDGLHFCPPVLSKTSSFVSAPLRGFVVVIFLWWLIRPARPHSTHRYLHWLMPDQDFLSRLGSPNLQNVSQYQLPPLLTQKVPSSLPDNYCCRKPPLLHHSSHNNCCW